MHQGPSIRLTAWANDPDARRQVILGGAVLLLTSIVVGLVHVASTTPELVTKLRFYVNPESARICSLARLWFAPCVAISGFIGCVACLVQASGEARKTKAKCQSLVDLQEASHWSHLMHATILAFICLMGIVSRPIAHVPTKSIVLEFTAIDSTSSVQPEAGKGRAVKPVRNTRLQRQGRQHDRKPKFAPSKVVAPTSVVSSAAKPDSLYTRIPAPPPEIPSVSIEAVAQIEKPIGQPTPRAPEPAVELSSPLTLSDFMDWDVDPNMPPRNGCWGPTQSSLPTKSSAGETIIERSKRDREASIARMQSNFGFNQARYLTNVYGSGEAFGLISKEGALEETFGETFGDESDVLQSVTKFALFEPDKQSTFYTNTVWSWNKPRFKEPPSASPDMTPPGPHRVRHIQNLGMAQPEIPLKGASENGITCPGPPARDDDDACGHFGPFLRSLRKQIYRHWIPSKEAVPRNTAVLFSVSKQGVMTDLMLDKTSGSSEFDAACLRAVEAAAPFMQLPNCAPDSVDIRFSFDRNVLFRTRVEGESTIRSNSEETVSRFKRAKNSRRHLLAE